MNERSLFNPFKCDESVASTNASKAEEKPGTLNATTTNRESSHFRTANCITKYVYSNCGATNTTQAQGSNKSTEALQPTQKRKRSSPSITDSDDSLASRQTCSPTASSVSAPSRQKRTQLIEQQQIQNKLIASTI